LLKRSEINYEKTKSDLLLQRCTQVAMAIKFRTVASDICGHSMWNLLQVTFMAPRIFRCLLNFWKVRAPLL
jgi:hypothetical protein